MYDMAWQTEGARECPAHRTGMFPGVRKGPVVLEGPQGIYT